MWTISLLIITMWFNVAREGTRNCLFGQHYCEILLRIQRIYLFITAKTKQKNLRFKGIHPLLQNNSHINVHSKCYFDSTDIFQMAINMPAHTLHLMAWLIFGGFSAIFQPCNGWHLKKEQSINLSVSHTTFSNTFNIKTRESYSVGFLKCYIFVVL